MRKCMKLFCRELVTLVFNPTRLLKLSIKYNIELSDLLDLY